MLSLGESVLTTLSPCLCNWKRYVDDSQAYTAVEKIQFILNKLNSFYPNTQFTFELEKNNLIAFLDVLLT